VRKKRGGQWEEISVTFGGVKTGIQKFMVYNAKRRLGQSC